MRDRNKVVNLARSWIGYNESDGSYKKIIDIYNTYSGKLPRNLKMQYNWSWCACTWSALAIKLGYTDIMPIEISCGELIEQAKKMGIWVENDGHVPSPGDAVLYDWDDSGKGDNTGWADHVGVVEYVNPTQKTFTVIEGNYQNRVKIRTMYLNGKFIRGFICPKYETSIVTPATNAKGSLEYVAREVIDGKWGTGERRKSSLIEAGWDYDKVQKKVNEILNGETKKPAEKSKEVKTTCSAKYKLIELAGKYETTANLYCRMDAGTNKKALCKFPKGTKVQCYGYYNIDMSKNGCKWMLVTGMVDDIIYTGFCSMEYLKRIS